MAAQRCRYCQKTFQPSKYHRQQAVCSGSDCQRQRRAEYHRRKIASDPDYGQVSAEGDAVATQEIGITCEVRCAFEDAAIALNRSTKIFIAGGNKTFEGVGYASLAQLALRLGDFHKALTLAKRAWDLAESALSERTRYVQGE